jgi:superfamily I DNA/RNA helicase
MEVPVITYVPGEAPADTKATPTIAERGVSRDDLLRYGIPEEWLDDILAATEEAVLDLAGHLPQEAAEAVLELAVGRTPVVAAVVAPEAIGVFVRSRDQVARARDGVRAAGLEPTSPGPGVDPEPGRVVLLPMHLAEGLEFRAVVMACCDEDVLPLQSRIEG